MRILALILITCLSFLNWASAEDAEQRAIMNQSALPKLYMPEWRQQLEESGYTIDVVGTLDMLSNLQGGLSQKTLWSAFLDVALSVDTAKAGWWENGTVFLYASGALNSSNSPLVGDFQGVDNMAATEDFKIIEAWYEHKFREDSIGILFGIHDFNSEFQVLDMASTLVNSSFGLSPDLTQIGPSTYPDTSVGLRIRIQPLEEMYFMSGIYDGVPGKDGHPNGTHIELSADDGAFVINEWGYVEEAAENTIAKLALGGWYASTQYQDFAGDLRNNNGGFYLIGEHKIFPESLDQALGAFFQFGKARPDQNEVNYYWALGLQYLGPLASRPDDILTLGFNQARFDNQLVSDSSLESMESVFELSYIIQLTNYFAIQPDLQYVQNPGGDASIDNATVALLRLQLSL